MGQSPENIPGMSPEYGLREPMPYALDRRAFLDVIWNRIGIIEFRSTTVFVGQVYPLPKGKDQFGRVKVYMTINPDEPLENQQQTLVHESIHVDRSPWERVRGMASLSYELERARAEEEELTHNAAQEFYEKNKPLVAKALNHLRLRSLSQAQ